MTAADTELEPVLYDQAHQVYRAAGWTGPLPLPAGRKGPPPHGFTGYHGEDPSGADSHTWANEEPFRDPRTGRTTDYRGTRQTALRMPAGVLGVDVDHYGDKRGGATIAEAARRWGPFPRTYRSTARGPEGASGIYYFRIPDGVGFPGVLAFGDLELADVELIQRHHRYAVVWPSIHPDTGGEYRWYGPDDEPLDTPPNVADLPELPAPWVEALGGAITPGAAAVDPETVAAFHRQHNTGSNDRALDAIVERFRGDAGRVGMTRHGAMVNAACWAAREAAAGRFPAPDAVRVLRDVYVHAMTNPRPGQRHLDATEARTEFGRTWAWAVAQANAQTPEQVAERTSRHLDVTGSPGGRVLSSGTSALNATDTWSAPVTPPDTVDRHDDDDQADDDEGERGATVLGGRMLGAPDRHIGPPAGRDEDDSTSVNLADVVGPDDMEQLERAEFELAVEGRIRSDDIRDEAKRRRAERDREPLRILRGAAFLDAPVPDYLVPRLLYRDGLAVLFGPPGAAKSFLALDLALSLATGTPWRDHDLGEHTVHYVMAEGQATNTLRTKAWLKHNNIPVDALTPERWVAIPTGILLTEGGVAEYRELVEQDQPDLIVLDTKNLMFAGKESQGEDYGAMLRVLHGLREAAGGCAVVLVDHTGLNDDTRTRGSNAQHGGIDTEVRVVDDQGVRRVEITRDKSGTVGPFGAFRLEQVEGVPHPPYVADPAVCVPVDEYEARATVTAALRASCWDVPRRLLPEPLQGLGGAPGEAACDVFRVLVVTGVEDGFTRAGLNTLVKESPRTHARSTVYEGVRELLEARVLVDAGGGKVALAGEYTTWRPPAD